MGKEVEDEKDKERETEEESPHSEMVIVRRDPQDREKAEAKGAFLSSLKYRQQEGDYSFPHTMWRVYEMLWEKFMGYGHMHETDGMVEDELCQDIIAWLSTMSGHGEEEDRKDRMRNLFHDINVIMEEDDSRLRVHKLFNLTGSSAFHHDIGFKGVREKTEFDLDIKDITRKFQTRLEEVRKQHGLLNEVQTP